MVSSPADLGLASDSQPIPTEPEWLEGLDGVSSMRAWLSVIEAKGRAIKELGKVVVSGEKARAREIMRIKTRRKKSAARKEALRRARQGTTSAPTKKPTRTIVTEGTDRRAEYMSDARRARAMALRNIARDEGVSVKAVRRIAGRLAAIQVHELVARGTTTVARIGRLRLNTTERRTRRVNVAGKIGRSGKQGLVECPVAVGVKFRPAESLRKALRAASEEPIVSVLRKRLRARGEEPDPVSEHWWLTVDEDGCDADHLLRLGRMRTPNGPKRERAK